jgi:hypothetical protein
MLEALWSVEFRSNLNIFGSGVVIFETDRIFGGDAQYYFTGKYEVKNCTLTGELDVVNYSGEPWSVFGTLLEFSLRLYGIPKQNTFDIEGTLNQDPSKKIQIRLTKRAELP